MRIVANLIGETITAPIGALAAATIYFGLLALKGVPVEQPVSPVPPATPGPPPGAAPPAV